MTWQDPNTDQYNDFITAPSQTNWEAECTASSLAEYDAGIPFFHQQYSTSGREDLNPNNVGLSTEGCLPMSALDPFHQAEITRYLPSVDDPFDNKQTSNAYHFPSGLFFLTAERSQDASSNAPPNPADVARPTTQRKPRTRQPGAQEWERHKDIIHDFYLKQNFSLATTMEKMEEIHQFCATAKMYKDKFKQWKWSKNLSSDMAVAMLSKANQRKPKGTVFHWSNQTWPIERIMESYRRIPNHDNLNIPEDCPTPPGVTCETPRLPDDDLNSLEKSQGNFGVEPMDGVSPGNTKQPYGPIDEGPFHINSLAEVRSVVQAARKASEEDDQEEAESCYRKALSCCAHLLSPTHNETVNIGYLLATFYAIRGQMDDADDILNWMTIKHISSFEACNSKVVAYLLCMIAFLRRWQRNEEADLLTYRLLENHRNPEESHFILKTSSRPCVMLDNMVEGLLASGEPGKLAAIQDILESLVSDSKNHKLLRDLLPRYIQICDQQTNGKLTIRSRCILADIWVKSTQLERAKSILREAGHLLKHQVATEHPLEHSTLKLAQRVAFALLEADDPNECDKVLDEVTAVAVTNVAAGGNVYSMMVSEFLISTASALHQRSTCERSRPWAERALSLCSSLFGKYHERTKCMERMLATCNVNRL